MLAEQAAENAAQVEEAYGGFVQRAFTFIPSPGFRQLTWIVEKKNTSPNVA